VLATRLYNMTEDKGMKDFLSFLIARDTMHQWLMSNGIPLALTGIADRPDERI
jgi:Mn-containing catalase